MSKYSKAELKKIAELAIEMKIYEPLLYTQLIWKLCMETKLPPIECEERIANLAN